MNTNTITMCRGYEGELPGNVRFCPLKDQCLRYESKESSEIPVFMKLPYQWTEEKCNFLIKKTRKTL